MCICLCIHLSIYYHVDMGHLSLKVGLGRSSEDMFVIGECLVPNLSTLNPHKPVAR